LFIEKLTIELDRAGGFVDRNDLIPIDIQQALQPGQKPTHSEIRLSKCLCQPVTCHMAMMRFQSVQASFHDAIVGGHPASQTPLRLKDRRAEQTADPIWMPFRIAAGC
jgi:hypothetical protein